MVMFENAIYCEKQTNKITNITFQTIDKITLWTLWNYYVVSQLWKGHSDNLYKI